MQCLNNYENRTPDLCTRDSIVLSLEVKPLKSFIYLTFIDHIYKYIALHT